MSTTPTASVQSLPAEINCGPNNELLVKRGALVLGDVGAQHYIGPQRFVSLFDDFIGDAIDAKWDVQEGTDSATSASAILAGGIGGVLRLTTGDAGTGLAADMIQVTQALQWQASNGDLVLEVRSKLSAITTCYAFIGFTDLAASLEAPIESAASADTITTNATNAVGFMFDTRMSTDNWWLVGVATDVDATAQNMGAAPVADTYATFRVEVTSAGVATFYYKAQRWGQR